MPKSRHRAKALYPPARRHRLALAGIEALEARIAPATIVTFDSGTGQLHVHGDFKDDGSHIAQPGAAEDLQIGSDGVNLIITDVSAHPHDVTAFDANVTQVTAISVSIPLASIGGGIEIDTGTGRSDLVTFLNDLTLGANVSLTAQTQGQIIFNNNAHIAATGSGSLSFSAGAPTSVSGPTVVTGLDVQAGVTLSTESGNVTLFGSFTRFATGDVPFAVTLEGGSTIASVSGNISITGKGFGYPVAGISMSGTITAGGSGTITAHGTSFRLFGIEDFGITRTQDGDLSLTGTETSNGVKVSAGAPLSLAGATCQTTGAGHVTLTGIGGNDPSSGLGGITLGDPTVSAGAGGISILADIDPLQVGQPRVDNFSTTGTLTVAPATAGRSITIGAKGGNTLLLAPGDLQTMAAHAGTVGIGDSQSGPILVSQFVSLTGSGSLAFTTASTIALHTNNQTISAAGGVAFHGKLIGNQLQFLGAQPDVTATSVTVDNLNVTITGNGPLQDSTPLVVQGSVDLSGATLNLTSLNLPAQGLVSKIVDNLGSSPITGTFQGLPDHAVFFVQGVPVQIDYEGGDGNDVTVTAVRLVDQSAGNLTVSTNSPSKVTLTVDATDLEVIYNNNSNAPIANFPLSNLTGAIMINLGAGADAVTLDFTNGNFIPPGGIMVNEGSNQDTLIINGPNEGTSTYAFQNATDGTLALSNFGTIAFTGVDSIVNSGANSATDITLPLGTTPNVATLADDGVAGNHLSRLSGSTIPTIDFHEPATSFALHTMGFSDRLTVGSLPDLHSSVALGDSAVSPSGAAFHQLAFTGSVSLNAGTSFSVFADTLTSASASKLTFDTASFTAGTAPFTVGAGTLGGTLQGNMISLSSSGTVTLAGDSQVGAFQVTSGALSLASRTALASTSLTVTSPGSLAFSSGTPSFQIGALTVDSPVNLANDVGGPVSLELGADNSSFSFPNGLTGPGGIIKLGAGSYTPTDADTFTGPVKIMAGTVFVPDATAAQFLTLSPTGPGQVQFANAVGTFTVGGLAGTGNLALVDIASAPIELDAGHNNFNTVYSGNLSGGGSLHKIGAGFLTLQGVNTQVGDITSSTVAAGIVPGTMGAFGTASDTVGPAPGPGTAAKTSIGKISMETAGGTVSFSSSAAYAVTNAIEAQAIGSIVVGKVGKAKTYTGTQYLDDADSTSTTVFKALG